MDGCAAKMSIRWMRIKASCASLLPNPPPQLHPRAVRSAAWWLGSSSWRWWSWSMGSSPLVPPSLGPAPSLGATSVGTVG
jgi:hypothetical protein